MFYDLRQGDSTRLLSSICDAAIDAVVTDPPYFIDGMGNGWNKSDLEKSAAKGKAIGGLPVGMKFDPRQGVEFQNFMQVISCECLRILKPGGFFISFSQPRLYHRMAAAAELEGFEILDTITWARPGQAKAFSQDHFVRKRLQKGLINQQEAEALLTSLDGRKTPQLRSESELVMLARKPLSGSLEGNLSRHGVGDILSHAENWAGAPASNVVRTGAKRSGKDDGNMHMTVKPVDLIAHLIRLCTREGQIVLDPFLGSGSHGVSAVMEGRSFIGFEMVEEYFDLSGNRIARVAQRHADKAPPAVMARTAS